MMNAHEQLQCYRTLRERKRELEKEIDTAIDEVFNREEDIRGRVVLTRRK